MLKILLPAVALLALTGCTSTGGGGKVASTSPAAASERAAFTGTWSGKLASGKPISVRIPDGGTPSYRFNGESVPVQSASLSGGSMVLVVGRGGGTVRLTPQGDKLAFAYRFRGDSANTVLSR